MLRSLHAESITMSQLRELSRDDYDQLPFGVIELDRDLRVRTYNSSESALARRSVDQTLGRHFFDDIAPCTDTDQFRGRVESLIAEGAVDSELRFDYDFDFSWGRRRVRIRAIRGTDTCWLFVTAL